MAKKATEGEQNPNLDQENDLNPNPNQENQAETFDEPAYGVIPSGTYALRRPLYIRRDGEGKDETLAKGRVLKPEELKQLVEICYRESGKTAVQTINRYLNLVEGE